MKQVVKMQRCLLGKVKHEVKVTRMQEGYGVRVYTDGELNQETRVDDRSQIGYAARDMLRWEDKCGNLSELAGAARARFFEKIS